MSLKKIGERFELGTLVEETFTGEDTYGIDEDSICDFTAKLRKHEIMLRNRHKSYLDSSDRLALTENDIAPIERIIEYAERHAINWPAYVACGAIFVGFTGWDYYPAGSKQYQRLNKNYVVNTRERPALRNIGGLQRTHEIYTNGEKAGEIFVPKQGLTVNITRYEIEFSSSTSKLILESHQFQACKEAFQTWLIRRALYAEA